MIILIGNQKGGAGKSTLTMLLANYLTSVLKLSITVIDLDYQQSIAQKFEGAKVLENEEPYQVFSGGLAEFPGMLEDIRQHPGEIVLVDLPGKLDDDGLIPIFRAAQLVLCPFSYDEFSFESTLFFALVFQKVNTEAPMLFVPNRIKANVKYEIMLGVNEQLGHLGKVTDAIPDRIDFQRTNTMLTLPSVEWLVRPLFHSIYKQHIQTKS
jgi:chromosome partitioning protein